MKIDSMSVSLLILLTIMLSRLSVFSQWIPSNKHKVNPSKTDIIPYDVKLQKQNLPMYSPLTIAIKKFYPSEKVRNLGVMFHMTRISLLCVSFPSS